jgi:tetratricopeptide (TPR) repeat protein
LLQSTRERVWARRVPELGLLRRAQASAALNRAVAIDPNLARAHLRLAGLYEELNFLDLALLHLKRYQNLTGPAADPLSPPPGNGGMEGVASFEEQVQRLADAVAQREKVYADAAAKLRVLDRAVLAVDNGLAGKARDLLLDSNVAAFGTQGMMMQLELLLRSGAAKKVHELTLPEHVPALGPTSYHWLRIQALAASGEYALAQEECDHLAANARGQESAPTRDVIALLIGQAVLDGQPAAVSTPHLAWRFLERIKFENRVTGLLKNLKEEANARVFRGLLALEEGDVVQADVAFRLALALWENDAVPAARTGVDFKTRAIAQGYLRLLE